MADFTLGTSTLGGGQFKTRPVDQQGVFREVQYRFSQTAVGEDMELHFFEVHLAPAGESKEDL